MSKLTLFSPAKINLTFKVIGRRLDKYHEVDTKIQAVDLGDVLDLAISDVDQFTSNSIAMDTSNLVIKAVNLFRAQSSNKHSLAIHLEKMIPIGSGLGGGSGNAATTLYGLNALFDFPFTERQLQKMGATLGADVPFFFSHGTAHCTGFGEIVSDCKTEIFEPITIAMPDFSISTPSLFAVCRIGEGLEEAALRTYPKMKTLRAKLLSAGYDHVFMTGSGSAFVCIGKGKSLCDPKISLYDVKFLNRKPDTWYSPTKVTIGENHAHENLR